MDRFRLRLHLLLLHLLSAGLHPYLAGGAFGGGAFGMSFLGSSFCATTIRPSEEVRSKALTICGNAITETTVVASKTCRDLASALASFIGNSGIEPPVGTSAAIYRVDW
jgi:hypothetical protein